MYQYQFATVPRVPVTLNVDVEPEQITAGDEVAVNGSVDNVFTVIVVLKHNVVLHVPSALT